MPNPTNFKLKIKFTSLYLQARFSENAKDELLKDARKWVTKNIKEEDLQWIEFSYFDENGYFVPGEQLEMAIYESGKDFKMKAKRNSLHKYLKAMLFITSEKNYTGKREPDQKLTSYVKRKDGNRVKVIHPAFNSGLEVEFTFELLDPNFSEVTLKEIIENAGVKCGLGARRPKHGRFEVLSLKKI